MKPIITVQGPVDPCSCGMVLSHEHLFIDLANQAAPQSSRELMTVADRVKLLCDPYCMIDNLRVDRYDLAVSECKELLNDGINLVVDCTLDEIGRNPQKLRRLSQETGVRVVMGCGWYTGDTHPAELTEKTTYALAEKLLDEIQNGVRGTGVRPGIIGEIGTSHEITPGEWKALDAAALVQQESGFAVQVHIFPWSSNGLSVVKKLTEMGVPPDRIVICHSDVLPDKNYIWALLKTGVFVEMDNFGKEFTPANGGFAAGVFARDESRAAIAAWIIKEGFADQLLLTNDICLKCMLTKYGGQGYTHVVRNIIPMIVLHGIEEDLLRQKIMRQNPIAMLTGERIP